jgi:hypothetical protein
MTRAVLGHTSRRTPTDHYVHVSMEDKADALRAYEAHLLAADVTRRADGTGSEDVAA